MPIPIHAKRYNFFARLSKDDHPASGHATYLLSKAKQEKKGRNDFYWMHKEFKKPILAEFEAAIAGLYALIEPDHIPKVRAIYDEKSEETTASISKIFPDFISLRTFLENGIDDGKINQLIEMGLAEILALSYFFEEDDLHKDNIGISQNKVVRIDFDMSAYSIVSDPTLRGPREYAYTSKTPEDAFKITSRDLNQFPKLFHADPSYFPTKSRALSSSHGYSTREMDAFSKLTFNHQFMERTYQTFMKIILMPDESFESTIKSFISGKQDRIGIFKCESTQEFDFPDSQRENYQEKFFTHFIDRKNKLREELIKTPRFRFFWERSNANAFDKMLSDVKKYNDNLKDKYAHLRINSDVMKKNYDEMCSEMKKISGVPVSDVTMLANDLTVWLEQTENKKIVLDKLQSAMTAYQNEAYSYLSWFVSVSYAGLQEIRVLLNKMSESKTTAQFLQSISQLLSLQSKEAQSVSEKLVSALLPEFSVQKTIQTDSKKLVEALVVALQPASTEEEGEWQTVTHFSSDVLKESFS